jgi:uncharacterized protein YjiS (DUF1127 family)
MTGNFRDSSYIAMQQTPLETSMSTRSAHASSRTAQNDRKSPVSIALSAAKIPLRISTSFRNWAEAAYIRRQLATLDLRLLDDIGITCAERDAIVLG